MRLVRSIAYCFRFYRNCKKFETKFDCLSKEELHAATLAVVKLIQRQHLQQDYVALSSGISLHHKSSLLCLNPFRDNDGVIRVGGRLSNSAYSCDKQHPILLPKAHRFVELLFKYEHNRLLHAGPTQLLSSVKERFWPISGKLTAKRIVHFCIQCFKWSPEYIHELQVRKKWKRECHNLQKGSLVLIKEKNQPPLCWALGRVIEVHFGKDNVPRVVTLRTTKGTIRRAAVKSPLPLACDDLQLSQPQFPVESTSFQSGGVYGAPSSQRPSFRAHERVPDRP
nr:unnamed protein product [Callosobruchus chinensis]